MRHPGPPDVPIQVLPEAHRAVLLTLIHGGKLAALDGHAAVREPVGWLGDHIHALWRHQAHQLDAVR